jgi:iron complex transport system ATP-binding protein
MGAVSSESVVEMQGVDVVRGETSLLRGIDWTVDADQRWVVLGPNGAGKTTLMRMLATLLRPAPDRPPSWVTT